MKKICVLLCAMPMAIGISTDVSTANVAYASNQIMNVSRVDNGPTEKRKAAIAYDLAQITAKIISTPTTSVEDFKIEFAYGTAQVTAKVMSFIPRQKYEVAYEMAKLTTRISTDPQLDIEKAKAEFAYEIAQITAQLIDSKEKLEINKTDDTGFVGNGSLLRNNADVELRATGKTENIDVNQKEGKQVTGYIEPGTYKSLVQELAHVGERANIPDNKVNVDGEVRIHYSSSRGDAPCSADSSGIRARIGFDTAINKDWRAYGMLEGEMSLVNYNNEFKLSRLYAAGKLGQSLVHAGSFGYLMAEGNIYDSDFKGVRVDFGKPVRYTLGYGTTDCTTKTFIAAVRYDDFDYNLEAGVYHYQMDNAILSQNTIWTLGGNYKFSNFSVGAMYLASRLRDSDVNGNGYVLGINYGDLKTYRPGTYEIFAKYYDQSRGTYITHGMNGMGNGMQGFKGYGLGIHYTFAKNLVGSLEFYDLTDKIFEKSDQNCWTQLTYYF